MTRLWGRQIWVKSRKGEQILCFSKTSGPDVVPNRPPIQWVVGPLGRWKQLGLNFNHSPAFTVLVKSEWSFTFDSPIYHRDSDKELPQSSQLYILCLVIVFNIITLKLHLCFIGGLWMFHWTFELYKLSLSLSLSLFERIVSSRHSCVVT